MRQRGRKAPTGLPETAAQPRPKRLHLSHIVVEIEGHLASWVCADSRSLLFTGPKTDILRWLTFTAGWDRARAATGLERLHFHDLRHTRNTLATATGASTKEIMARMGHSSARAALIYQHASHMRDAMIADSLSEIVQEVLQKPAQEDSGGDFRPNEL